MPGRYVDDTSTKCLISTVTEAVPSIAYTSYPLNTSTVLPYNSATVSSAHGLTVTCNAVGSGFTYHINGLQAGVAGAVTLNTTMVGSYTAQVLDNSGGVLLGSSSISGSGSHSISYTGSSGSVLLKVILTSSSPQSITLNSIQTQHDTTIVQPIVVNSCNNDFYRFGFNGKLKDNEWAGLGNHVDFGARALDTRNARLGFSLDMLATKTPSLSPYLYAADNPIWNIDKEGKKKIVYTTILTDNHPPTVVTTTTLNDWKMFNTYDESFTINDYHINQTLDLRKGADPKHRLTQSNPIPDNTVNPGQMLSEDMKSIFGNVHAPVQFLIFGSGHDYADWLKNPKAVPGVKTISIDFSKLDGVLGTLLTGMVSEPEFNAETGPKSFQTAVEKGVDMANDKIKEKMNSENDKPEYEQCESCGQYAKDGKIIHDTSGRHINNKDVKKRDYYEFHNQNH